MENLIRELRAIKNELDVAVKQDERVAAREILVSAEKSANELGASWSKSWLGYHANLYYEGFALPPPGKEFDIAAGKYLVDQPLWVSYSDERVVTEILDRIDADKLPLAKELAEKCGATVQNKLDDVISILQIAEENGDQFIGSLLTKVRERQIPTRQDVINQLAPGKHMTRDQKAMAQGPRTPPHISFRVRIGLARQNIDALVSIAKDIDAAIRHLRRRNMARAISTENQCNVFIGHGRSLDWLELEKFLKERLDLQVDEFKRVATGGMSTKERLEQMLNSSCFAFIVMTAEDEIADDKTSEKSDKIRMQARMNVIHEAGLFQGKLGFDKAIILLEKGCEEFSNIHGLGQIRFDKGQIEATFEEVRRHLEQAEVIPK